MSYGDTLTDKICRYLVPCVKLKNNEFAEFATAVFLKIKTRSCTQLQNFPSMIDFYSNCFSQQNTSGMHYSSPGDMQGYFILRLNAQLLL